MFEGRNDFVLTVFAKFTDNEQWDVSEQSWAHIAVLTAVGGQTAIVATLSSDGAGLAAVGRF